LEKYKITLVTGEANFNRYKGLSSNFLKVIAYADPKRIRPALYEDCDLIISRAGASTVSEILYIKRPAILIPLPRTFMNEQYKNAEYAEDFGIAKVMTEEEVVSGHLPKAVDEIFLNWGKIVSRVSAKPSPDLEATQKIVDVVEKYI
jgi:UDP-N-acetylglucosamine--N-acetylmuramyl-(pentapeptide) pyrophosphoryl-undecaprenol N-acetylglucosamine transferase